MRMFPSRALIWRAVTALSCKAARSPRPSPGSMAGIRCCGIAAPPILAKATARWSCTVFPRRICCIHLNPDSIRCPATCASPRANSAGSPYPPFWYKRRGTLPTRTSWSAMPTNSICSETSLTVMFTATAIISSIWTRKTTAIPCSAAAATERPCLRPNATTTPRNWLSMRKPSWFRKTGRWSSGKCGLNEYWNSWAPTGCTPFIAASLIPYAAIPASAWNTVITTSRPA